MHIEVCVRCFSPLDLACRALSLVYIDMIDYRVMWVLYGQMLTAELTLVEYTLINLGSMNVLPVGPPTGLMGPVGLVKHPIDTGSADAELERLRL